MSNQERYKRMNSEDGSALVTVLLVLLLLTMLGISSMSNATFESAIVRNETIHSRYFYRAESAIQEAVQRIETFPLEVEDPALPQLINLATIPWIHHRLTAPDFTDPSNWSVDPVTGNAIETTFDSTATWIAAVEDRVDSLDPTKPGLRYYTIFALTNVSGGEGTGRVLLQVGHKRRI